MVTDKIKELLARQLGITVDSISDDSMIINDLRADSLDIVEIVMAVEETFNIEIEDNEYANADTVEKLVQVVTTKIEQKNNND